MESEISIERLLTEGDIELYGLFPWSSNYTFLVNVSNGDLQARAIYKPSRGERPLWDFPEGTLALREVAAYVVSQALGWRLVPPTVLRDGPHGPGALQLYIQADPQQHYFTFGPDHPQAAQRIALFDVLVNNADRKAGHCLMDAHGHIWAIDHGLCFSAEPKLRSVIWDYAGQPIPAEMLPALQSFKKQLGQDNELKRVLARLLADEETHALARRLDELLRQSAFPVPGPQRHYPWPLI